MSVRWAALARRRLVEIHDHIAADAPERARAFVTRLIDATEQLEAYPFSGALLPEDPAYRQLVVHGYRIVYRIAERAIFVATIVAPGMVVTRARLKR